MTKAEIDTVLNRVRTWPQDRQAEAARLLQTLEHAGTGTYTLSVAEAAALAEALAEVDAGSFISDEDMAAFWNRNG